MTLINLYSPAAALMVMTVLQYTVTDALTGTVGPEPALTTIFRSQTTTVPSVTGGSQTPAASTSAPVTCERIPVPLPSNPVPQLVPVKGLLPEQVKAVEAANKAILKTNENAKASADGARTAEYRAADAAYNAVVAAAACNAAAIAAAKTIQAMAKSTADSVRAASYTAADTVSATAVTTGNTAQVTMLDTGIAAQRVQTTFRAVIDTAYTAAATTNVATFTEVQAADQMAQANLAIDPANSAKQAAAASTAADLINAVAAFNRANATAEGARAVASVTADTSHNVAIVTATGMFQSATAGF